VLAGLPTLVYVDVGVMTVDTHTHTHTHRERERDRELFDAHQDQLLRKGLCEMDGSACKQTNMNGVC
jgi:hypothetical protein